MELDVRLMLTVGGMLISVVSAAAIARYQIKNILDTLGKNAASLKSLDRRVDTIEADNETEQFRFGPSPDTTYTGYLSYYKNIAALSDSNTTNPILDRHPGIYLYGSLFHSANFLGGIDPQQTQNWLQMYVAALERCENNDKQDSYGGAPVQQRTDIQTDLSFYRNR